VENITTKNMIIKKQNIIAILTAMILGLTILTPAYAAEASANKPNFFSQMVTFIAQKFGLDKTQVQTAVTQFKQQKKTENQQNMQNREKTRFDQLVKDGKITQSQEDAILKEMADLKTKYNPANMKNLTVAQRQQQMQAQQAELKAWAQANGIDLTVLMPVRPSGMPRPTGMNGKFPGRGGRRGVWLTPTPTS